MLRRVNGFWLGAGVLLFVFGANEFAAYLLAMVPRWLGGWLSALTGLGAMTAGVLVAALLGVRPPLEDDASDHATVSSSAPNNHA